MKPKRKVLGKGTDLNLTLAQHALRSVSTMQVSSRYFTA